MREKFLMTLEWKKKLELELQYLKNKKRKEIIKKIKHARSFGDLSENFEYESIKSEQSFIEGRIYKLERMIKFSKIINNKIKKFINIGNTVTFINLKNKKKEKYTIVGISEANPLLGKISNVSPIAKALIGKFINDIILIKLPNNEKINIKIIKIE